MQWPEVVKSEGGFIWACKNYDGDVMSDLVATAFGSLAMMTSVLVSPKGYYEFRQLTEPYRDIIISIWKEKRRPPIPWRPSSHGAVLYGNVARLDAIPELVHFADVLEQASLKTIESGKMTKDLALITSLPNPQVLNSSDFY